MLKRTTFFEGTDFKWLFGTMFYKKAFPLVNHIELKRMIKLSPTNSGLLSHCRISIRIYDAEVSQLLHLSVLVTVVALRALALLAASVALF